MEGIIPRSARYLFHKISMGHVGGEGTTPGPKITKTKVMCTFCEVYNENVYDLLNLSNDNHAVRWNAKLKKFTVPDLLSVECNTVDELMTVVAEGESGLLVHVRYRDWLHVMYVSGLRNRTIGSTAMNKDSSRSHRYLIVAPFP